ncbi:MAG: NAD(P)/FAD-dependent oxidoreductase [Chthoniobacter sp.]|nr:NAD(P)/FAD-dependent oxidoreductase [Chthoniobacter sp.]
MNQSSLFDVAVVGGGLAGLATALYSARAGQSVILFEKDPRPGGRAATQVVQGFHFNLGPHALYGCGQAIEVLKELGIHYGGSPASYGGAWVLQAGKKHPWPGTPLSLVTTKLLSAASKLEAATLFESLDRLVESDAGHLSVREWLDARIRHADLRVLFEGLVRLSTYCDEPGTQSASAALTQTAMGRRGGVLYLDGGWQTLVDRLREATDTAGVRIETRSLVAEVHCQEGAASVVLANGERYSARSVIFTAGPAAAARLINGGEVPSLRRAANEAGPIQAACLDVALRRLPCAENQFAIGLDHPWYYSVHSRSAKLAPDGGAVIQVAKYLSRDAGAQPGNIQQELEGVMDWMQPGWREELVERRFMPRMLVANSVVTVTQGDARGRPGCALPEVPNLFLAGDWVGPHGMLADASLASARDAARLASRWLRSTPGVVNSERNPVAIEQD